MNCYQWMATRPLASLSTKLGVTDGVEGQTIEIVLHAILTCLWPSFPKTSSGLSKAFLHREGLCLLLRPSLNTIKFNWKVHFECLC